jgi:tetratricopeptide (TPR) repeat protein
VVAGHDDATEFVSAAALTLDRDPTRDVKDPEDPPLPPGTVLGRYVIIEAIGRGGMGHVYAARDPELERRVAIKTLRRRSVSQFGGEQLLLAEAQALAKLSHPNVVAVYDAGTHDDSIFIAMEHIEGITVQRWLETTEPTPTWQAVLDVFLRAGRGLAAAHRHGIIHRDFKPSNVMIDAGHEPGRVRVVDFGLALTSERDAVRSSLDGLESSSEGIKSPRIVVGTPGYMAPEQMDNEGVDARSDQFSFCVSLWTALYGVRPFAGTKVGALRREILGRALQQPSRAPGPRRIRRHLARGLEADPARRWPSMDALLEKLESDRRLPRRRALGSAALAAAIALPAAGYVLATARAPDPCPDARPRLAEVWGEAHAQAIEAAFGRSSKPFASQVWLTTRAQLDAWADGWVTASDRACTAARVDMIESEEVHDRRARCLGSARTELAAMVELLREADDATIVGAVKAVSQLPSPQRCADADLDDTQHPDPAIADRVAELEHAFAGTRALFRTAGYARAAAELERLTTEAQAIGWQPLLAEMRVARGETLMYDKRFEEAEQLLLEGLWTAMPIERDHTAAEAWVHLVRLAAMRGQIDDADRFSRHAQAFLPRLHGAAPELELSLLTNRGLAAFARGDYEAATGFYTEALTRTDELYGGRDIHNAAAHNNLGTVYGARGDHRAAVRQFEQVLALTTELLGDAHPDVASALGNIAVSKQKLQQIDEARSLHAKVIAIREEALGPDHPDTGVAYGNLGAMELDAEQAERAVAHLRRALSIKEQSIGVDHPSTLLTRTNLATALIETDHAEEALALVQPAYDQLVAALGPEHPTVFYPRLALGRALVDVGRAKEAVPLLEAAVASRDKDTSDPEDVAEAERELARARTAAQ